MADLSRKIDALQLNLEGLLKLLGGSSADRLRFWEILKGVTSVAEFELIGQHLDTTSNLLKQVQANVKSVQGTATKIARTAAKGR
ncbi:MAG: hypothetical protein QOE68_475 [Thermoanaerobaculia bacterium]|jgi:hypothetical protein|nr:hypothetical protein [Thermoanaerobaculia bacterium]